MALHRSLQQPNRNDSVNQRAQSFNTISNNRRKMESKPISIDKTKSTNIFRRKDKNKNKNKPKQQAFSHPVHMQPNGIRMDELQYNWNNRQPYQQKRKQLKAFRQHNLPRTEFKVLLDEHQMSQCYEPVKLYELNKELMANKIGTCRVEALTLIISVPNGRKDLAAGIQIVEKIIGPVEYLDDESKASAVYHRPSNTIDTKMDIRMLHSDANDRSRKRQTSLFSDSNATKSPPIQKPTSTKIKLSELSKRKKSRRYSEASVSILQKNHEKSALHSLRWSEEEILSENENETATILTEQEWDDFDEVIPFHIVLYN